MDGLTTWWTREQLAFARSRYGDETGSKFREDRDSDGAPCGGAYSTNLSPVERGVLEGIEWARTGIRPDSSLAAIKH